MAPESATQFYHHLDRQVQADMINTTLGNKINGFPYLRTNRFLTHLKDQINSVSQKTIWITYLQDYALAARTSEIRTLPDSSIQALAKRVGLQGNASRWDIINRLVPYFRTSVIKNKKPWNVF